VNKKIIFWVDGSLLTYVIANSLQHKMDGDFYSIIEITDRPKKFFLEQKFVNFKKTWYYHDHIDLTSKKVDFKFLKFIEEKYNINLWLLAQNERLFNHYNEYHSFTTTEILCILQDECKLFDGILNELKPDFFIVKETALHQQQLFFDMCRSIGVKILTLYQSKFGYQSLITTESHRLDHIENLDGIESKNRNFKELQDYLKSFNLSKQLIEHKNNFLSSKKEKLKAAFQLLFISKNLNLKNHFAYKGRTKFRVLYKEIIYSFRKTINQNFLNSHSHYELPKLKNFIYFSLHQEPERVLLIDSPFYTNQLETIRHIAKSLPIDHALFVKEHPTQSIRGWHHPDFYKSIIKIPNVFLLHPSISTVQILKNCSLAITVNGTTSLEAAFYGKPSIVFSNLGYSVLPSVHVLNSVLSLPTLIKNALKTKVNPDDVDKYISLIEQHSFEFDLLRFITDYHNYFYYGGHLIDVEITTNKMKKFLDKEKPIFDILADEYIKKIMGYENN
jgi:hypothetical protein